MYHTFVAPEVSAPDGPGARRRPWHRARIAEGREKMAGMIADGCRLYIITPERFDLHTFPALLAQALDAGDVAAVQLRLKNADDDAWKRAIDVLRPVSQSRGVAFLLNDRADLVVATGCDGAHVGQEDMPAQEARRLMGLGLTLGVTCKSSPDLAHRAVEDGADYVAFGAFFPSTSKQVTNLADPEILRSWSRAEGPALLRHRRHHRGESRPAGAGGGEPPRHHRRRLEPPRGPGRGRPRDQRGHQGRHGLMGTGPRPPGFTPGPPMFMTNERTATQ